MKDKIVQKTYLLLLFWSIAWLGTTSPLYAQNLAGCTVAKSNVIEPSCDFLSTQPIVLTATPNTPGAATVYVLTTEQGIIIASNTSPSFPAQAAGGYYVFALTHDGTISGITAGANIQSITGNDCIACSAGFELVVCYSDELSTAEAISVTGTGGNVVGGNSFTLLTDDAGSIIAVQNGTSGSFAAQPAGKYFAYIYTTDDGTTPTVGQNITAINATGCSDWSEPFSVNVTVPAYVALLPKVFLQGALFGVNGAGTFMRDDLRVKNLIPLNSPYPGMGLTEVTPTNATTTAVLSVTGQDAIVDWVYVELRDATDPTVVRDTRSALVQRDGDIVEVDGVSQLIFNQVQAGSYYVVVKHRNHLGVMSKSPVALSAVATVVDFRLSSTPTFNKDILNITNEAQVVVDQGVALWAGNALHDNQVIYQGTQNDVNAIYQLIATASSNVLATPFYKLKTYNTGDIDMNGETIFQGTKNDVEYIYQNIIKNHPGNVLKQNFFIIKEQLP